jgi:HEAT repeats/Carboxypeptidase regulatory-like domain
MPAGGRGNLAIRGRVTDSNGALVPGVQVLGKNAEMRLPRLALTDETGTFTLSLLSPGRYVVSAELAGFVTAIKVIDLKEGTNSAIDFILTPPAVSECPGPDCGISVALELDAAEALKRQSKAERLAAQMWGVSMERVGTALGNGQPSANELRRREITQQLHQLGKEAVTALLLALGDPDVQLRRNAALVLGDLAGGFSKEAQPKLDVREALPGLIQALADRDSYVRAWSAQVIGEIGSEAVTAVPALIQLLDNADDASRNSACIALGKIGAAAKDALPFLVKALNDANPYVRVCAEQAIAKIGK